MSHRGEHGHLRAAAARALADTWGLDLAALGERAVDRAVRDRLAATGLPAEAWIAHLEGDPEERVRLAELVLVPETMLFRDGSPFAGIAALAEALRPRASAGHPVRILSAACSTGEEPFSVAITLLAHGIPADAIRVAAIDVSRPALDAARSGRCARSALRGPVPGWAEPYLERRADGSVVIDPVARSVVSFSIGNLLDAVPQGPFDAILCRNVLVYLLPDARRRVLATLHAALAPSAPLFVGHSEVAALLDAGWRPARRYGPYALEWSVAPATRPVPAPTPAPRPAAHVPTATPAPARTPAARIATVPAPARPAGARPHPLPEDPVETAGELAQRGDRAAAIALLQRSLESDPRDVAAHALLGVLHATGGDDEPARAALRRALYLDPTHAEARAQLALLGTARRTRQGGAGR